MSNKQPAFFRPALQSFRGSLQTVAKSLSPLGSGAFRGSGGWSQLIQEPFAGAWQQNQELAVSDSTRYFAVYACTTLSASDIGKRPFLVKRLTKNWWQTQATSGSSWRNSKPNHYQTPSKFKEQWILSKLLQGNTYALKKRAPGGRVEALYILDPTRVTPLVSNETGEVFYQLSIDNLSGLVKDLVVPASEIIHDRMNCLFHPLVGIPPLYAAGLSANMGLAGQNNMLNFVRNASNPGGILTAPGEISKDTADSLKEYFNTKFSGSNAGRIAVVGDGLKFERMAMSSHDAQLLEHLRWSAESICACFHVPAYMVIGVAPASGNIEVLREQYYGQCLQALINSMQECLDDGLDVGDTWAIELDLAELVRADTSTRITSLTNAVKGSIMTVNEARFREDLPPVEGGDTVYMQQQNYSLEALSERDKQNPLLAPPPAPAPVAPAAPEAVDSEDDDAAEGEDEEERSDAAAVANMLMVLERVANGALPAATASIVLSSSFPRLTAKQIQDMLEPLAKAPEKDDESSEELARAFLEEIQKGFLNSEDSNEA